MAVDSRGAGVNSAGIIKGLSTEDDVTPVSCF